MTEREAENFEAAPFSRPPPPLFTPTPNPFPELNLLGRPCGVGWVNEDALPPPFSPYTPRARLRAARRPGAKPAAQ